MKNRTINLVCSIFAFVIATVALTGCGDSSKNDTAIQSKISAITQTNPELANVSASVAKGVVTLVGQCRTEKDRAKAEKEMKDLDDVDRVINNISVNENIVVASDNELRDGVSKVVKKFKHVQAEVNNGIITLRGEMDKDDLTQFMVDLNSLRPRRIENQLVVR